MIPSPSFSTIVAISAARVNRAVAALGLPVILVNTMKTSYRKEVLDGTVDHISTSTVVIISLVPRPA